MGSIEPVAQVGATDVRLFAALVLTMMGGAALIATAPGAVAPARAQTQTACDANNPIRTSTPRTRYTVVANGKCGLRKGVKIEPARDQIGIDGTARIGTGGGHTINVNGMIVTTGRNAHSVWVIGDNSTVTVGPDGRITTSGDDALGIFAQGNKNTLTNRGTITTSDNRADGIHAQGNKNTLTNSGTITTGGNNADGLFVQGDNNTLTNSGTITTGGESAYGIFAFDKDNTLINSGTITTRGEKAHGILALGDKNTLINSGAIIVHDEEAHGIVVTGKDNTIVNSGLIRVSGADSFAIYILVRNPNDENTITLLPNSRLIGLVQLSRAVTLGRNTQYVAAKETFNFHNRVSTVVTFDDAGGLPKTINTDGSLYLAITPTTDNPYVVVVDPNAFSHADKQLHDLTAGISNSVHAHLDASRASRAAPGVIAGLRGALHAAQIAADIGDDFAPVADPVADPVAAPPSEDRFRIWAQGFGSHRDVDVQGIYSDASHALYGGILGADMALDMASLSGLRLGAFAGYSKGDLEIGSGNSQNVGHHSSTVDTDTFFGGVYADYSREVWYARLILSAGRLDNDSTRLVMDNAPGGNGYWLAKGSYDGMYVSPEVALGADVTVGGMTLMPSVRLRYAHLSLDGYTETGRPTGASASELTVGDRDVNLFGGRVQVAIERSWGAFSVAPRVGVEAYSGDADNVSVTIAGQGLSFAPGGDDGEVTGFIGARLSTNLGGSASLFMDGEAHFGDGTTRYEGRLGAAVHF